MDPSYNNNFGAKGSPDRAPNSVPNGTQNQAPGVAPVMNSTPKATTSNAAPTMNGVSRATASNVASTMNSVSRVTAPNTAPTANGAQESMAFNMAPMQNPVANNLPQNGTMPNAAQNPMPNASMGVNSPNAMNNMQPNMTNNTHPNAMLMNQFGTTPINPSIGSANSGGSTGAIGSGGDIVLNNESEKKSRKGLIIGGIAAAVLVVVGVIAIMATGGGSGGQMAQTTGAKNAYNSYANYVLLGEESEADLDGETMIEQAPYFDSLSDGEKNEYVEKANQKYEALKNAYQGENDLTVLKSYFQDYAKIEILSEEDIIKLYTTNGYNEEKAKSLITERYSVDSEEINLEEYLTAEIALAEAILTEVKNADIAGCIVNNEFAEGCYTASEAEDENIDDCIMQAIAAEDGLVGNAYNVIIDLYDELYGVNELESE